MYAIIDIETTGGNPYRDKITEIAIFVHDGQKVIKTYQSLINPERKIPYFISRMTGITDEMVAHAPRFYEIAKDIVEITDKTIIVAHNASFDYNFIKSAFRNLGYNFHRDILCTVKLARKIIPGKMSYSLGKLCKELNIAIENRHRASGDALATVRLFEMLLEKNPEGLFLETIGIGYNNSLNHAISRQMVENLPQKTGIYYFIDERQNIIYIGKSKNIRLRVLSHLNQIKSKKSLEMVNQIADISYDITGSELLALLKESEEIKRHKPLFNRQQRRITYNYGLFSYIDSDGYMCLKLDKVNNGTLPFTSFSNLEKGKSFLFKLTEKFKLCQNLTGLFATHSACFQFAVNQCNGACIGQEKPVEYNPRVQQAIEYAGFLKDNLIVLDKGRTDSETSFMMIENGRYLGYGFIGKNESLESADDFKSYLQIAEDNRDVRQIISAYLRNKRTGKRIKF